MKILCKEAFITIHHRSFCRVSLYCFLGWHDPRDSAVYHLFWNGQILLRSLSHTDWFTASASPLRSVTLPLLASINGKELRSSINRKGWDLRGSLRISCLFYWKMQRSKIKYLSSHLKTEAWGTSSASVMKTGNHPAPLQSCLWVCNHEDLLGITTLQVQAAPPWATIPWGLQILSGRSGYADTTRCLHGPSEHPRQAQIAK